MNPPVMPEQDHDHTISIIIPFYNEEGNVLPCVARVCEAMQKQQRRWELLLVNDGSRDRTSEEMLQAQKLHGKQVHCIELQRNFGQTAAMQAGLDVASSSILVTLDGDMQNDPADISAMVEQLIGENLDLLVGWRKDRKDKLLLRKVPSRIANFLIGKVTGVPLHDYGCSLKVYRASVMNKVRLYGEMHRFIPAWVAAVVPAHRISERVVAHRPRVNGASKYGISRTFRVVIDLLSVWFFMHFKARPGHFFGSIGLALLFTGSLILGWLGWEKFFLGNDIGTRPLLLVGVVSVITALQFLTTGVLAELLSRVYFETGERRAYILRSVDGHEQ